MNSTFTTCKLLVAIAAVGIPTIGLSVALLSDSAMAQARGYFGPTEIHDCDEYVKRVNRQIHEEHDLGCGFRGPRWLANPTTHYRWCLTASPRLRANEDNERAKGLQWCRGDNAGPRPVVN